MASKKIVRTSKYRHLFGTPTQTNECILGMKAGAAQTESNVLKGNGKYYAVPWFVGGTVAIIPVNSKGAVNPEMPLIIHDDTTINDIEFNPFNDSIISTACQNGTVCIWQIPEEGLTQNLTRPVTTLKTGEQRILSVDFHPLASNVLLSFESTKQIRFWDIESQKDVFTLPDSHKALPTNLSWNLDGSLCATSCKDKMLRVFDPRANKCVHEVPDHPGTKGGRVLWLKKKNMLFTCGFAKGSERQLSLYDPRKIDQKLCTQQIDTSSSSLMPFFDEDNSVLYLAGKGDGNIRYYEVAEEEPHVFFLNEYKSKDPQSGMMMMPKWSLNVMNCEIGRLVKLTPQGAIIPVRFEVPRKEALAVGQFQDDIFPDTFDTTKPSLTGADWFNGASHGPHLRCLNPGAKTG